MKRKSVVSAGAVLLVAALYFFGGAEEIAALFSAVLVHEAGHAAVICLCGGRIRSLSFNAAGLSMVYSGVVSEKAELLSVIMGPLFGILAALLTLKTAPLFAYISLFLSAYNLLPALPLDGGRALYCLLLRRKSIGNAEKILTVSGIASGLLLLFSGLYALHHELGLALIFAGIYLLIAQTGIVKSLSVM